MLKTRLTNLTPEKFFVVIALFFGLLFVFITPLFQAPDEPTHFLSIARYSNGYLLPNIEGGEVGARIQSGALEIRKYYPEVKNQAKYPYGSQVSELLKLKMGNFRESFQSVVSSTYAPFSYLPYIIIYIIGAILQLNPFILLLIMKITGLLVWVGLSYLAIKIIPRGKWLLTTFALLPMTLFTASAVSADNFTNGLVFVVVAMVFYGITKPKVITKKYLLTLIGLTVLLALTKQTFFFVSLLLLALPTPNFISKKKYIILAVLVFILCVVMSLGWQLYAGQVVIPGVEGVNSSAQLKGIISHPQRVIKVAWNTFLPTTANPIYIGFVGVLGVLDVSLPIWVTFGWLIILIKSIGKSAISKTKVILDRWQISIFIITTLLLLGSMAFGLYLAWTPVGAPMVNGIQGRYLLPLFAILIPVIASRKDEPNIVTQKYLMAGIVCFELITMIVFIARYIHFI